MRELDDFLVGTVRNQWIFIPEGYWGGASLNVYLRKGKRRIWTDPTSEPMIMNAIEIASLAACNLSKREQMSLDQTGLAATGAFRAFHDALSRKMANNEYDGVFVENVLNPYFAEVLRRYGYNPTCGSCQDIVQCFWQSKDSLLSRENVLF